jgi:hypothetical protein
MNSEPEATLSASVLKWALIIGSISFTAGYVGPLLLSSSNLGPLLGIFVTGPVGIIAGALWGAVRWAVQGGAGVGRVARSMAFLWMMTLLYTLFMVRLVAKAAVLAVGVQILILAAGAFLLFHQKTRTRLPIVVQRCGPIVLAMSAIVAIMTAFPPVMRPWWGSSASSQAAQGRLPLVAFILDPGFDASRHIPEFTVNVRVLILEWMVVLIGGSLTCYLVGRRTNRPESA